MAAFIPEPHILLIVVQPVPSGSPAPSDAWRAGAWPWPAGSTQPMITSCTSSGLDLRALDGGADRGGAELRGGEAFELALERAHRGAGGANDDDGSFSMEASLQVGRS